jgi:hypothetical protein
MWTTTRTRTWFMYEQSILVEVGTWRKSWMDMVIIYEYTMGIGMDYTASCIYFSYFLYFLTFDFSSAHNYCVHCALNPICTPLRDWVMWEWLGCVGMIGSCELLHWVMWVMWEWLGHVVITLLSHVGFMWIVTLSRVGVMRVVTIT